MRTSFQKIIILFFTIISIGIIFIFMMSYRTNKTFRDTSFWVKHTQTVLDEAEQVSSYSKDLQLESSGYYFLGDSTFLHPFRVAKERLLAHVAILKNLTVDNVSQQQRISALQKTVNALVAYSDKSIQLRSTNGFLLPEIRTNVIERSLFRSKIESLITAIRNEENRLLSIRQIANNKSIAVASTVSYILIGFIFTLLLLAFFIILYHFGKRKKAEEELRQSDARFHLLVNNIKDYAIFMMDNKGNIMNWYSGAEYIKGYTHDEVIGKPIAVFYTKDDIEQGVPERNLERAAEIGSYETQGWRVRKDGSRFWADVIIRAIYDEKGRVQGFTKVTRDFTLHKKAEDNIREALEQEKELSEMKSNFVSMASHEFRTPLSAILSSASLLEQYTTTEQQDKRVRHIKKIKSSVANLTTLLEEFLSLEKIEQGKVAAKVESFDIKDFTASFCKEIKDVAKPGQTITYNHYGEEQVQFDSNFLSHILTNLTSNAIKYSPENSPITIETDVKDGTMTLRVADKGIGISAEAQKHLFERFYRASNVVNIQGTGLGLHIVKQYVDLAHGTIRVKSEEGKGTEFIVELKNQPV